MARLAHRWPPVVGDPYENGFLGDDEYTYVVRRRGDLVQGTMDRLTAAYPPMAAYDQRLDLVERTMAHVGERDPHTVPLSARGLARRVAKELGWPVSTVRDAFKAIARRASRYEQSKKKTHT